MTSTPKNLFEKGYEPCLQGFGVPPSGGFWPFFVLDRLKPGLPTLIFKQALRLWRRPVEHTTEADRFGPRGIHESITRLEFVHLLALPGTASRDDHLRIPSPSIAPFGGVPSQVVESF